LPDNAPLEYKNRSVLWNAVEKIEKNKNSQLAREVQLALPRELSKRENLTLVRMYVQKNFVDKGMCADICLHDTGEGNPHAHIMLTMRPFNTDKTWGAKSKKEYILDDYGERIRLKSGEFKSRKISANDWNEQTKAEEWREDWAKCVNFVLARNRIDEEVDHRSYERQGAERVPTIHLGVAAHRMEKRGIKTERGNINRHIAIINQQIQELIELIKKGANLIKEETQKLIRPIVDTVRNIPATENKMPTKIKDRLAWAKEQADKQNAQRKQTRPPKPKLHNDRDSR